MTTLPDTEHALPTLGSACLREGVARRHGRRRNPARTPPRSQLRTPTTSPVAAPSVGLKKSAALSKAQIHRTST